VNDSYSTNEDITLSVPSPGVLLNDSDVDGDPPTVVKVSGPANGTLNLNANGFFTYTPNLNWSGTDTFTYQAYDGLAYSNTARVTITVNPVNDAPVAEAGGPYTGNEGSVITFNASASLDVDDTITLYEWDWDYDGDYDESTTSPIITHTWSDDHSSMVRLRVTDNGGATTTDVAIVTVNNVAPIAEAGGPYNGREGLAIILSGSATDPGTDALSYAWDLDNNGNYETPGQSVSNTWSQAGTYTVRLRVTDDDGGEGFDTATVNVQGLLHISGLVQDLGAISLEGITFYLKDQAGNTVGMDISAPQPPNPDYDIECYPGTYDLVVDARVRDLELTFHDITIEHDITDADIIIEPYPGCPYSPPAGKRHVKSIEISAADSIMVNGVTVRMYYTDSEVRSAEVNESTLRIYHYTEGAWQQVPTAVDTANNILTATLSSLSPNGAFGDPPARGVPVFPSVYVGIAAALGTGVVAYFVRRRLVDQK
jgi:VCBS repeat-containing protein